MTAGLNLAQSISAVPKRLRIAVLSRKFDPAGGGAERYSIAMVEQLALNHDIHVFAQHREHLSAAVTYHLISTPLHRPRWVNQLWYAVASWWVTRRGFDIVHSHESTWHGNVQTVHVLPVKYNLFRERTGLWRLLRWVKVVTSPRLIAYLSLEKLRYAESPGRQIVLTSESLRSVMATAYPTASCMISVITPGITLPVTSPTSDRQRDARTRLGLPLHGSCVLFVGNDYQKKGLAALLKALQKLPSDVILAVVGNPAQIPFFKEQVQHLHLESRVFFLGSLKDVTPAYEAADCLVHPTLEDTFAMVVLEAMAHALPVLVSGVRWCGISGLLTHGVNALILDEPTNADRLAEMIPQLLGLPPCGAELRQRLAQGAQQFASRYQWHEIALQQEALYFKAISR